MAGKIYRRYFDFIGLESSFFEKKLRDRPLSIRQIIPCFKSYFVDVQTKKRRKPLTKWLKLVDLLFSIEICFEISFEAYPF